MPTDVRGVNDSASLCKPKQGKMDSKIISEIDPHPCTYI